MGLCLNRQQGARHPGMQTTRCHPCSDERKGKNSRTSGHFSFGVLSTSALCGRHFSGGFSLGRADQTVKLMTCRRSSVPSCPNTHTHTTCHHISSPAYSYLVVEHCCLASAPPPLRFCFLFLQDWHVILLCFLCPLPLCLCN